MIKIIAVLISMFFFGKTISAQGCGTSPLPPNDTINGVAYWYGFPVKDVMDNTDLIFEGRILSDSSYLQRIPGKVYTYHKILVLKQFKGNFKSDTLKVVSVGGKIQSEGTPGAYAFKGDEAVIFASVMKLGNTDPDLYYILYGDQCGFKKICGKKDVDKEVYRPIEEVTGQKYIEIHPNTCKTSKANK
ncbi:MAG: hypothetical protein JWO03_2570 [Bacteroidetes bacterium]|nr:hypothetical protein [Bacteroidota bacterium]